MTATPAHSASGWSGGWFVVPHEVTWRDIDGMRHVNNAVYFTYFEWGRTKYWFALQGKDAGPVEAEELGFIVVRAECDFRAQIGLAERIEIRVRVGRLGATSIEFEHEVRTGAGELAATGKVVAVLWSWERGAKVQVDDGLRGRIRSFEQR